MLALESNANAQDMGNSEAMRAIAYSMDMLFPGLYLWCNGLTLKIGGKQPEDKPYRYPGQISSPWGVALVLPGYQIFTTYTQSYDAE